ncbi:cytochrome c oxidase assembly protein COX20, mitochondrial [Bacillus rossius redtenbacheri]|uniref:cytochrome c oxidase assembly protein COX20, mitochondrial n=1 Tax=Bacillus rossius redtenbacheri TaxID=93214 RepID=UPI002FDD76BA
MEENDTDRKTYMLFGRDVSQIPCFRDSYLYGISGGLGAGLLFFLFTSRIRMATHVGFGSFVGITLSYWAYCRYTRSVSDQNLQLLKQAMDRKLMYEGTAVEEQIEGIKKTDP